METLSEKFALTTKFTKDTKVGKRLGHFFSFLRDLRAFVVCQSIPNFAPLRPFDFAQDTLCERHTEPLVAALPGCALRVLRGESLFSIGLRAGHAGIFGIFLLTGCTLGPDYLRPNILTPSNHRGAVTPAQAESLADIPWWELFQDPVLQELTREAISNNYDLRAAAARVQEARAQIGVARSFFYPQLNANASGIAEQVSRRTDPPEAVGSNRSFQNWFLGLSMAWELDVFGRIRRETEAATSIFLATEQARRGVLIALIADVAQSYFVLRELDLELEISRRTLRVNDETVEFYRRRLFGGVSNQLELDQSVANRSRTAASIPELERQIVIQENLINFLVGRNPGPIPRGAALTDQYQPPTVPVGLPSDLLERRPDVKAAEDLLVAANANIGAAKALFFPTFSLTGALGGASHDLSNIMDKRAQIWSIAGGVLQPVFQGWRILFNYEATQARFDQALAQYERAAQNGFREVADALVSIEKFRESRVELERSVQALGNAARLSRLRYDTGLANYLEILIADQQLFDQEILLARARGSQLTAVVQLYRALGGGWQ
jgi:multidrug efflux system outer membrane protein